MKKLLSVLLSFISVIILIFFASRLNYSIAKSDLGQEDIFYIYKDSEQLINGINPYTRILGEDMFNNKKYTTYFPLFFEVSFISMKLGIHDFDNWIVFWQKIFYCFDYAIALLFFIVFAKRNLEWGGVIAAGFWLFNRWTLFIISIVNIDFIPIFFMLVTFVLFPQKKWLALLLFSVSLGLKQIGIFLAPLFLIWAYRAEENHWNGIKNALKCAGVIASVPLASSLLFIFWNLEGFVKSIVFSVTRYVATNGLPISPDAWLGWEGLLARIPMAILMLAIYWMAIKGIGKFYLPAVLIFTVFISFNTVLFTQYWVWFFSFIPLLMVDYLKTKAISSPASPSKE